ncbi:monocarboxylate transporter 9-like isoform X1 [Choristoneura fumiferana]|uniref:monocarboxylate transporter 9-like isoform X1 n=1 Tax=Choristoneura fumiferana TaxID=7141 RepID=UPI003D15DB5F
MFYVSSVKPVPVLDAVCRWNYGYQLFVTARGNTEGFVYPTYKTSILNYANKIKAFKVACRRSVTIVHEFRNDNLGCRVQVNMSVKEKYSICSSNSDADKYELVPPEGGWGYLVCVGLSVIFIAGTAHQPVFGFIYNDFLDDLGVGTGAVTVVYGVFQVTLALAGFSANIALKRLSLRQVGLIGAFIYTLASFLAIFVTSTTQLVITNGFLQGLGMGLLIPISYTSFNSYFTKKKVLYLSLCKASIGLVTMVYPLFIRFTITEFGFRGTLAILCAISAHSIFGAAVMQPVEWHMVKQMKPCEKIVLIPPTPAVEKEGNQFNFVNNNNKLNPSTNQNTTSAKSVENLYIHPTEKVRKASDFLFVPKLTDSRRLSIPVVLIPEDGRTDSRFNSTDSVYLENLYKAASVSSLGNFGNIAAEPMPIIKNKDGKWQTVADYLDLTLLKDWIYDNIAFGMALAFFADLTFFTLEPLFLDRNGLSRVEIANIIAIGGATDMTARLLLGVTGHFFNMNSRYMFFAGAFFTAVFRIVLIQCTTYTPLLILTGVLGALRSLIHIAQPIVMAEHVPIERYPPAYGLYMLLCGALSLSVGPMIGFIRDYTDSYAIAFYMLTVCNLCCVVPWSIEGIIRFSKRKNKTLET